MNIQRYILPATIAATVHVALLWLWPQEDYVRVIAVPLGPADPLPPKPVEPPVQTAEEKDPAIAPVEKLAGGPVAPDLPDEATVKPAAITIPVETRTGVPIEGLHEVPRISGPGIDGLTGGLHTPIFKPDQLDHQPRAKVQVGPEYPVALRHGGIAGSVVVEFDVDRAGQVTTARVVRSSHREFAEPTLRAVLKWRFEPGRRNGQPVPFRMQVPVDFRVEE